MSDADKHHLLNTFYLVWTWQIPLCHCGRRTLDHSKARKTSRSVHSRSHNTALSPGRSYGAQDPPSPSSNIFRIPKQFLTQWLDFAHSYLLKAHCLPYTRLSFRVSQLSPASTHPRYRPHQGIWLCRSQCYALKTSRCNWRREHVLSCPRLSSIVYPYDTNGQSQAWSGISPTEKHFSSSGHLSCII